MSSNINHSMRKIKKRIFTPDGPSIYTQAYLNGMTTRFKNTRINLQEDMEIGPEGHKETGNILQFIRAQQTDSEAFCFKKKLRVLNGKSTTVCEIGLSDEALEAIYIMLRVRFEGVPDEWKRKEKVADREWTDEALRTFIDTWPPNMPDVQLSQWLNEMKLPMPKYMMAVDYYKKTGPDGKHTDA